jgi:hypothetical protein
MRELDCGAGEVLATALQRVAVTMEDDRRVRRAEQLQDIEMVEVDTSEAADKSDEAPETWEDREIDGGRVMEERGLPSGFAETSMPPKKMLGGRRR